MALRIPPRPTDGIATITLSQPDNKNALSTELVDALGDHLMSADADKAVRCVMLTNEGKTPSARAPTSIKGKATAPPRHSLVDLMAAIVDCPKPVIGRIAGHCTGGVESAVATVGLAAR